MNKGWYKTDNGPRFFDGLNWFRMGSVFDLRLKDELCIVGAPYRFWFDESTPLNRMNSSMKIKFSQDQAFTPVYAEPSAAGMDIKASVATVIEPGRIGKVQTGLHVEIPECHYGALVGRSGLAAKGILAHYGTIDSSYRGPIGVILFNTTDEPFKVNVGNRIAQLIIQPYVRIQEFEVVDELSFTQRGENGFGSSGK